MAGFRTGAGRCSPEISVGRIMNVQPNGWTATLTLRTRSTDGASISPAQASTDSVVPSKSLCLSR